MGTTRGRGSRVAWLMSGHSLRRYRSLVVVARIPIGLTRGFLSFSPPSSLEIRELLLLIVSRWRALMPRMMEVLYIVSRLLSSILITARGSRGRHVATVVRQRGGVAVLYSKWPRL